MRLRLIAAPLQSTLAALFRKPRGKDLLAVIHRRHQPSCAINNRRRPRPLLGYSPYLNILRCHLRNHKESRMNRQGSGP